MARIAWWFLSRWPITTAAFDTPLLHSLLEYIRYNPTVKDFKCTSTIVFICQHIRYLLQNKNKSRNKQLGIFAAIYKYERSRLERLPWRLEQRFHSAKRGRNKKKTSATWYIYGKAWQSVTQGYTRERRQWQRKHHLKINLWEMVTILRLLLLPRILYSWQRTPQMDW